MGAQRRIAIGVVCGACGLLVATCGPSGVETMGDAMVGVGDALADVGAALRDGFADDASAQPRTFDGTCVEETRTYTVTFDDGRLNETSQTYWVASVDVPGLDPATVQHATVVACDNEDLTIRAPTTCPTGATCSGETFGSDAWLRERCSVMDVQVSAGRASAQCGYLTVIRNVAADGTETTNTNGNRWGSMRFVIEP